MPDDTEIRIEDPDFSGYYHACTWLDFRLANCDDTETLELVGALEPGEDVQVGGGAIPTFRIRRVEV